MNAAAAHSLFEPTESAIALYQDAFAKHGRCEEALLWGKGKQHVRFAALCKDIPDRAGSLLDFGCGLGDLAPWLQEHRPALLYTGADAVPDFITSNRAHLPAYEFLKVTGADDLTETYDYVVCSGVFNIDTAADPERHWQHIQVTLADLFKKTRVSIHFDFLAHDVDFRKQHAHHQDLTQLIAFIERRLTKRYMVNRTYMPYEYSLSLFADAVIERPQNIYAANVEHGRA